VSLKTALAPERTVRSAVASASRLSPLQRLGRGALYLALAIVAIVPLFPLYWLVISSFKTPREFSQIPPTWFPVNPTLEQVGRALTEVPFAQSLLNSVIIAGGCTISVVITSTFTGFVFAKHRFRGRDVIFWTIIATMFLPPVVTLVPLYAIVNGMGLGDSYLGVMLPWLANAFGIFLMRQFISSVPDELIEAARMDGAGEFRIVVQFIVPLVKPAIVTLAIFMFVYAWNNFLWPVTILRSEELYPVVLTVQRLMAYTMTFDYRNVVLAGTLLASLPTLILFLLAQRVFVQGIAATGIKG